ncbi:MAG: hypothetical protein ABI867_14120 [Kofleriaceae bacterium]
MMRVAILLLALCGTASAEDTFEARAHGATRASRLDEIVWAVSATCEKGDDVQQRQCRQVRDHKLKELAGATLLVDGDPAAFELGPWNAAKRSIAVTFAACVRCAAIEVEGKPWHIVGTTAAARLENGKLRAARLHDTARTFADEATAKQWTRGIRNVRVQLLVKLPAKPRTQVAGKDALQLEITAWRVMNPCDGSAVIAGGGVAGGSMEPDQKACGADPTPPDGLPEQLSMEMVAEAMKPVDAAARACFKQYTVAGKAKLELVINADGTVARADQLGDFKGKPTGSCIDLAVKKLVFPKTRKPKTKIGYPIVVP